MIIPLPVSYEWRCISWSLPKWNRGVCRLVGYVSKGGSLSFRFRNTWQPSVRMSLA
ncbi:hypothetical protein [Parapedobacter defluvii]|uniref:hypothetical protein n=1 Tax=Parapedobacter defluvii TaxID=2045106 RepID=UPI00166CFD8F|nr:hypothetical protein [Parapedobacter defluvii]